MRFHNALVHVRREAEIVGVDYQLFSRLKIGSVEWSGISWGSPRMSLASDWISLVAPLSDS